MANIWKMITSLFTTAGAFNYMALIVYGGIAVGGLFTWQYVQGLRAEIELARQVEVVQKAAKDKAETLDEARTDEREAKEIIDSGNFDNDFLKRLQHID